jgi:hypothetical protein
MHFSILALYGGPDQVMTVTSGIASIIGIALVFWHKLVNLFFRIIGRKPAVQTETKQPASSPDSTKTPTQAP